MDHQILTAQRKAPRPAKAGYGALSVLENLAQAEFGGQRYNQQSVTDTGVMP